MAENTAENTVFRRKLLNFKGNILIVCFFISFSSWFFIRYAHDITINTSYPVEFIYGYSDRILVNVPDNRLYLQIRSNGLNLLLKQLFTSPQKLQVRLKKSNLDESIQRGTAVLTSSEIINQVSTQLGIPFGSIQMTRDSLFFSLEKAFSKKVPIRANVSLSFDPSFYLYGKIATTPDSVELTSTEGLLSKISFVETENKLLQNLNSNQSIQINLIKPSPHITMPVQQVNVQIPIEKYTETKFLVPVTCDSAGLKIKFFPNEVSVKCLVAFKDFKNIIPNLFKIVINKEALNNIRKQKVTLKLTKFPSEVKVLYLDPPSVDYLILK